MLRIFSFHVVHHLMSFQVIFITCPVMSFYVKLYALICFDRTELRLERGEGIHNRTNLASDIKG